MTRWGSGCGSVGRVVAPDTRDPLFKSQHRQKRYLHIADLNRKDKNKWKKSQGLARWVETLDLGFLTSFFIFFSIRFPSDRLSTLMTVSWLELEQPVELIENIFVDTYSTSKAYWHSNMHLGIVQSRIDLCVSLLQQKVKNNKTCRSKFIWQDAICKIRHDDVNFSWQVDRDST